MKWAVAFAATTCLIGLGLWALRPALPDDAPVSLRPASIDTIVVFGTSLSSAPRYNWPDDLGAALGTCTGQTAKIMRVTKPGVGSTWGLQNIDTVSHAKPDLVILEFAINDADLTDGVTLTRSRETHAAILESLRTRLPDAQILLMTTNHVSGLNWLKRYRLGAYYRLYTSLSRQYKTGLIHMHPHWQGRDIPDGVHPRDRDAGAVMVPQLLEITTAGRCALAG